jgi:hypothetical protein
LPVALADKVRLFMNIATIDFTVTVNLVAAGNMSAMPLRHGGLTTANVPFCIFLGWDQRRHFKSHPFLCFMKVRSPPECATTYVT